MVIDVDASAARDHAFVNRSAELLARAFHDYPEYSYLFPDEGKRRTRLVALFAVMTRYCLRYGRVIASSDRPEAVLMYLPPPASIRGWAMVKSGAFGMLFKLGPSFLYRQGRIISVISRTRATVVPSPHAYLFLLATDPASQRRGHAAYLMRRLLEHLDGSRTPCYLETSDPANVGFYQRFGFVLVEEVSIDGAGVTVHGMIREGKGRIQ
ncbi:MAG: GNAT family N-acetyltransferase [Candidatus Lokiarchaeota archaeon]|nr:GNAT family N-acetyltransferase [Candidatus Lokiarchaeota archaeon]